MAITLDQLQLILQQQQQFFAAQREYIESTTKYLISILGPSQTDTESFPPTQLPSDNAQIYQCDPAPDSDAQTTMRDCPKSSSMMYNVTTEDQQPESRKSDHPASSIINIDEPR